MAPLSPQQRRELDDAHSNRTIELDPSGYFLIRVDAAAGELVVQHFGNGINEQGLATDPDTGEVLSCRGGGPRAHARFRRSPHARGPYRAALLRVL